jgi:hypothetical protein
MFSFDIMCVLKKSDHEMEFRQFVSWRYIGTTISLKK